LSAGWAPERIHVHAFLFGTILLLGNVLRGFCWIRVTVGVHFPFLDELCFLIGDERSLFRLVLTFLIFEFVLKLHQFLHGNVPIEINHSAIEHGLFLFFPPFFLSPSPRLFLHKLKVTLRGTSLSVYQLLTICRASAAEGR